MTQSYYKLSKRLEGMTVMNLISQSSTRAEVVFFFVENMLLDSAFLNYHSFAPMQFEQT